MVQPLAGATISGIDVVLSRMENLASDDGAYLEAARVALSDSADKMVLEAKDIVTEEAFDTGALNDSIGNEKSGDLEYTVFASIHYASAVEFGTLPHWVPIKPLLRWAKLKLKGQGDINRLAYGTQKKIAEFGTDPVRYFQRSAIVAEKYFKEAMVRAFKDVKKSDLD